jgi:hypothetical protein
MTIEPCPYCGHKAHPNGPCEYEFWDDGEWYEGTCCCGEEDCEDGTNLTCD